MKRAVLIAGPTASGKSEAALAVAEHVGGVVVNADSMQIYRDLRVLSARPDAEDEARIPHRLYGTVAAGEVYSVGRWLEDAAAAVRDTEADGKMPVIVGGTGLYFHALLHGLSDIPDIPADMHAYWKARLLSDGPAMLHVLLRERDPALAARLQPADGQRIVRGLEVFDATGRALSAWQQEDGKGAVMAESETLGFVLWPPREELYARCDARFAAMIDSGALDEVRSLMQLDLDPELPVMKALGVRQLMRHLGGQIDLADAISDAQTWTRRYAKRQMTWFRRNMITWNAVEAKDLESTWAKIFPILCENELTGQT